MRLTEYNLYVVFCNRQKGKRGLQMTLHDYCSNSGKDLILDYINSLPEDEKTDKKLVRKRASELGKQLGKTFI